MGMGLYGKSYIMEAIVMLYITGDTHGNFKRIGELCKVAGTTKEDILIILGDAGFNYYLGIQDLCNKAYVAKLPITVFCIRGNHEERPQNISTYKEKKFMGGKVYVEKDFPNILFAEDGEFYEIAGKSFLTIGGAYSVDKHYRLQMGYNWYKDEQLTKEEMKAIEQKVANNNWDVDYVLTHTCPYNVRPTHMFLNSIDQNSVDTTMEQWLQRIANKLSFKHWYFGHYHGEWEIGEFTMLYKEIKPLYFLES